MIINLISYNYLSKLKYDRRITTRFFNCNLYAATLFYHTTITIFPFPVHTVTFLRLKSAERVITFG